MREELNCVVVSIPEGLAEAVANHLMETGAPAVEVRDATTLDSAASGRTEVVMFVPKGEIESRVAVLTGYLEDLKTSGTGVDPWSWREEPVQDEDWVRSYRRFFKTTRTGRRFVVRPEWEPYEGKNDEIVLTIDPGQAFGTGTHPSTRLCLRAIERVHWLAGAPDTVLDLGSGSGLLAVAAARLWPDAKIVAVDIDPTAVEETRKTADLNKVSGHIAVAEGSIDATKGKFDLILANLQADVLGDLSDELIGRLSPRGRIAMSGVLSEQGPALLNRFTHDMKVETEYSEDEDEWRMLLVRRYPRPQ